MYAPGLLRGQVAFVTGGATGICRGIALGLGEAGARVFIVSRKEANLQAAVADFRARGVDAHHTVMDVRDPAAVEAAVAQCVRVVGAPSVVVNGAAGNFLAPAAALSPNGFKTVVDIDLNGTFNVCRAVFESLGQTRGNILNVTATLHYAASPLMGHAAAAKAGVDALTRTLAAEWGPFGIRVNSLAPGPIEGTEGMGRLLPESARARLLEHIPLRRMGTVEDCARAAVFLCSPLASYVNGATLVVDGGAWLTGRMSPEELAE